MGSACVHREGMDSISLARMPALLSLYLMIYLISRHFL